MGKGNRRRGNMPQKATVKSDSSSSLVVIDIQVSTRVQNDLFDAVQRIDVKKVKKLVGGSDIEKIINLPNDKGNLLLTCAITIEDSTSLKGKLDILKALLDNGADPIEESGVVRAPLFDALINGASVEVMELLCKSEAVSTRFAHDKNNLAIFVDLIILYGRSDLITGCLQQYLKDFKSLSGNTLLHIAARLHREDVIDFLLKNVNLLHSSDNITDITKSALEARNSKGMTPLHVVFFPIEAVAKKEGIVFDGNKDKSLDNYPQLSGTDKGKISCIGSASVLCENGANVNALDNEECTPLHCAVQYANALECRMLIEKLGANLNIKNKDGKNALHLAIESAKANVIEITPDLPKEQKSRIEDKIRRNTKRSCDVVKMLLDMGMDIEVPAGTENNTSQKLRPLDLAEDSGNVEMINLLRGYKELGVTANTNQCEHMPKLMKMKETLEDFYRAAFTVTKCSKVCDNELTEDSKTSHNNGNTPASDMTGISVTANIDLTSTRL